MKNIIILIALAMISCACDKNRTNVTSPSIPTEIEAPTSNTPPPFTFGYYWMAGDQPGMGSGDYLDEAPWANVAYISIPTWEQSKVEELAEKAKKLHLWIIYSVVDEMQGTGKPAPDSSLERIWNEQLPKIRAFASRGILHSVYIGDEPVANGVPTSHMLKISALVKNSGFRTMIVEHGSEHISVDYFGISCYAHIGTPGGNSGCRNGYYHSDANILVIPGFYTPGYEDGRRDAVGFSKWDQLAWDDLAKELRSQGRLNGVLVFLWPSLPGMIGSRDDNDFITQHKQIVNNLGISR